MQYLNPSHSHSYPHFNKQELFKNDEDDDEKIAELKIDNTKKHHQNLKELLVMYGTRYLDFIYSPRINFVYDAVRFF